MAWSFSIGRLFGSDVRIHLTFFLLLAWIGLSAWLQAGPNAALINVAFICALFACVVAHEFGHALAARYYGIKTPDITLLPIGGLARLERIPERPSQEFVVAIAGPAVNVLIWAVLVFVVGAETNPDMLMSIEDQAQGFWGRLAAINLFLVVFNLIPAFPMDGGRVLRALLSTRINRVRATKIAARIGQGVAILFALLGLTSGQPVLLLIAGFVFLAAGAESSFESQKALALDYRARDVMIDQYLSLELSQPISDAADAVIKTTQVEFPIVDSRGELVGFLDRRSIIEALRTSATTPLKEPMNKKIVAIREDAPLSEVLGPLQDSRLPAVAIVDGQGSMLGYVSRENVGEWFALRAAASDRIKP